MLRFRRSNPAAAAATPERPFGRPHADLKAAKNAPAGKVATSLLDLPVLQEILTALPSIDAARLQASNQTVRQACGVLQETVLAKRGFGTNGGWRVAHAIESALFRDFAPDAAEEAWTPGPNDNAEGNLMEREESNEEVWLWLSNGTDWQAFQGGSRVVSQDGIRPSWLSFRVRVATPELSGANLAVSSVAATARWGLEKPVLLFGYRGDEPGRDHRCFRVEVWLGGKQEVHSCPIEGEVTRDRVFCIAIRLDWARGELSAFVDGRPHVHAARFESADPIRVAAIYNWRSGARTAFSELLLGPACPHRVLRGGEAGASSSRATSSRCGRCGKRSPARLADPLAAVAVVVLLLSIFLALQQVQ